MHLEGQEEAVCLSFSLSVILMAALAPKIPQRHSYPGNRVSSKNSKRRGRDRRWGGSEQEGERKEERGRWRDREGKRERERDAEE